MHEMPVAETADFVSLRQRFLLIKSRSLLPTLVLSNEEANDIQQLEYRLALYKIIKDAAQGLKGLQQSTHAVGYLYEGQAPGARAALSL